MLQDSYWKDGIHFINMYDAKFLPENLICRLC
jgi:hypothetical protein